MDQRALAFLESLLDAPGPSGFEILPARAWRQEANTFSDQVRVDVGGNSYATINGDGVPRIMLAGHIDEIGLMVVYIDDDGFLTFDTIGGWDHQVFVGQRVVLLGREDTVHGVIGKKAIHLMEEEDRTKVSKAADLWIDIGAATKAEAEARIRVGDPGVLASQVQEFPNGRLVSRSIDDRIGAFVVLEALRLLAQDRPVAAVTAVATAQEEIAHSGGGARTSATGLEADELEAEGLEFLSQAVNARESLDKGAIAFCIFVGPELAHIGWVAMTEEARRGVDALPYRVDFRNGQACTGGTVTTPKYRGKGLMTYGYWRRFQYIGEKGVRTSRNAVDTSNIASNKVHAKFNPRIYAQARYVRILWWKWWKEKPLT